jgi:hypothetical protein
MAGASGGGDHPGDARTRFLQQQEQTRETAKLLRREIGRLKDEGPDEPVVHDKCRYMEIFYGTYKGVVKRLGIFDLSLMGEYEDLDDGSERKIAMDLTYTQMKELLHTVAERIEVVLGLPSNWFSRYMCIARNWVDENKGKCIATVVGCAGVGAVVAVCKFGSEYLMYHFFLGAAFGLVRGVVFVALAAVAWKMTEVCRITESSRAKASYDEIQEMVTRAEGMTLDEIKALCGSLRNKINHDFKTGIPENEADRVCGICGKTGAEVVDPVKPLSCKGHHFMCKTCWNDRVSKVGGHCCSSCPRKPFLKIRYHSCHC